MGSHFQGYRKSSGFFGIVPEVLEGFRGYHSGAHLSRMTNMDRRGSHRPTWARHTSPPRPMRLDQVDKIKSLENRDLTWGGGEVAPLVLADPKAWRRGQGSPPRLYKREGRTEVQHIIPPSPSRPSLPPPSSYAGLAKPCRNFPSTSTTTPSCCWDSEGIYHTSAAHWNGERMSFINTVRTTECGSAAGLQHKTIDYINNEI